MEDLFNPSSVALVGVREGQLSVGFNAFLNLVGHGYKGRVYPVTPRLKELMGISCYPDLASLPEVPQLVMIMVNHVRAVEVLEECGALGVKNAIIVAGGYKEYGEGRELEDRIREICRRYCINLVGPNTLGFANVKGGVWPLFWHLKARPGSIALLSQSGGVGLTVAHHLYEEGMGMSKWVGVGNRTVLEFADYLDYLVTDEETGTVGLFIEGTEDGRRLYQAARRLAAVKPVAVYKVGEREEVDRAARTHTGSMAGSKAVYSGAFRQAGVVETFSPRGLAIALKALDLLPLPRGNRLCILTFTAGPSIVAMDELLGWGWKVPPLGREVREEIRRIIGEATPVDIGNPVDMTGPGFLPEVYVPVARLLLKESFDAYLFFWSYNPNIRVPVEELLLMKGETDKPLVVVLLGVREEVREELERLQSGGIPLFLTPEDGARALGFLLERRRLMEVRGWLT